MTDNSYRCPDTYVLPKYLQKLADIYKHKALYYIAFISQILSHFSMVDGYALVPMWALLLYHGYGILEDPNLIKIHFTLCDKILTRSYHNRIAWQWAETLVEITGTLVDIRGTTK